MSAKDLLFCNLKVLGYEASLDAFDYVNVEESQKVLHHLFKKLDLKHSNVVFSTCWPILKKQDSARFRQAVMAWLEKIHSSELPCKVPMVNMGLLVSPGGWKMYEFLFAFSQYVLYQNIHNMNAICGGVLSEGNSLRVVTTAACLEKKTFSAIERMSIERLENYQKLSAVVSAKYRKLKLNSFELNKQIASLSNDLASLTCSPSEDSESDVDSFLVSTYGLCRKLLDNLCTNLSSIGQIRSECIDFSTQVRELVNNFSLLKVVEKELMTNSRQEEGRVDAGATALLNSLCTFTEKVSKLLPSLPLVELRASMPLFANLAAKVQKAGESCSNLKCCALSELSDIQQRVDKCALEASNEMNSSVARDILDSCIQHAGQNYAELRPGSGGSTQLLHVSHHRDSVSVDTISTAFRQSDLPERSLELSLMDSSLRSLDAALNGGIKSTSSPVHFIDTPFGDRSAGLRSVSDILSVSVDNKSPCSKQIADEVNTWCSAVPRITPDSCDRQVLLDTNDERVCSPTAVAADKCNADATAGDGELLENTVRAGAIAASCPLKSVENILPKSAADGIASLSLSNSQFANRKLSSTEACSAVIPESCSELTPADTIWLKEVEQSSNISLDFLDQSDVPLASVSFSDAL